MIDQLNYPLQGRTIKNMELWGKLYNLDFFNIRFFENPRHLKNERYDNKKQRKVPKMSINGVEQTTDIEMNQSNSINSDITSTGISVPDSNFICENFQVNFRRRHTIPVSKRNRLVKVHK